MSKEAKEIFEFGSFRLDVNEHLLERSDGGKIDALPEKAFQTLVHLLRNGGTLVSKKDLLSVVWPDTTVEENNLDKAIHTIRNVLGETKGESKYIETVRKHGYRFVAEVRRPSDKQDNSGSLTQLIESKNGLSGILSRSGAHAIVGLEEWSRIDELIRQRPAPDSGPDRGSSFVDPGARLGTRNNGRLRRILIYAGIFALFLSVSLGAYLLFFFVPDESVEKRNSLLVLPVRSLGDGAHDDLLEVGMADSLINALGTNRSLIVRPLNATRRYVDSVKEPQVAGAEQRSDYVLEASYQIVDGRSRVTGRLTRTTTGLLVESFKFELNEKDPFALQDAVAAEMSRQVFQILNLDAQRGSASRGTNSEEAYRLQLEAKYLYGRRNLQAAKRAVELLEEAVAIDPNYASAWAAKAHAHRYAGNLGRHTDTHAEYQRSIEAANKALSIDGSLSEAYSAICENKLYYEFDFESAARACRRAIELDPNSSFAHEIYGRFLYHRGRFDEGLAEIKEAIDLDPGSLFNQRNLGIAFYYSGRFEEAEAQFKRVIAMDEGFASAYMWLRNTYEIQGKFVEGFDCLIAAQRNAGAGDEVIRQYREEYASGGYMQALRAHSRHHESYNQFYVSAILHAQIGEHDRAFEFLETSFERREWGMNSLLIEPQLRSLHNDPRFAQLVERVGLKGN